MGQFTEKMWPAVPKVTLSGNGTANGGVPVADASNYYVNQVVSISTDGTNANATDYQISQVFSATLIYVRIVNAPFRQRADMTAYLSGVATITAAKQTRPHIVSDEVIRATFAEEPAVAVRTLLVDAQGDKIGSFSDPTTGTASIAVTTQNSLVKVPYDAITATYPTSVQSVYTYHTGGIAGPVVATVTVNYTNSTQNFISSVVVT